jgi:hypothetical protein
MEDEDTSDTAALPADDLLAGIADEAALIEGATTPTAVKLAERKAEADAAAVASAADEARDVVNLAGAILVPLLPERYAKCYGPTQLAAIGDALGAVAHKRGWSLGGVMGEWGPEIALLAACAGPILPVVLADAKKRREGAASGPGEPAAPAPSPAPAAESPLAGERVLS